MDDPSPQQPLGTEVLQSSSHRSLTYCMDGEGAGSSFFFRQDLKPRRLLSGTTLDLTSGSLRILRHKQ